MTTLETLLSDPDTAGVWNLVSDKSTISFKIRNMWGLISVKGRFADVRGDGQITGKGAIFGRVDIQVASLHTGIRKRDQHLRSADFFDAERFPEISAVVTALEPTSGDAADLRATFTIKGVTAPVPLPVRQPGRSSWPQPAGAGQLVGPGSPAEPDGLAWPDGGEPQVTGGPPWGPAPRPPGALP